MQEVWEKLQIGYWPVVANKSLLIELILVDIPSHHSEAKIKVAKWGSNRESELGFMP